MILLIELALPRRLRVKIEHVSLRIKNIHFAQFLLLPKIPEFAQFFFVFGGGGALLHPPWPHSLYTYDKAWNSVLKENTMFEFRFELIPPNVNVLKIYLLWIASVYYYGTIPHSRHRTPLHGDFLQFLFWKVKFTCIILWKCTHVTLTYLSIL